MKLSSINDKTPIAEYKIAEEKGKTQLAIVQKKIEKLKKKCRLTERARPVASSLEKVLKKHKTEVVAYHSGRSFVGNHANKYHKSETIEDITEIVKRVCRAHTHNKNINDYARDISEAFEQLNALFFRSPSSSEP